MKWKSQSLPEETGVEKTRVWLLLIVLSVGVIITCLAWPSDPAASVITLSRADGKPRFETTSYSNINMSDQGLRQRLAYSWWDFKRRHTKPNPLVHSFPASPVQPCDILGLLSQCMEIGGTKYLIAVEALGADIDFGHTNMLNGAQWVNAFESAITNQSVICYDYAAKRNFQDKLLLIVEENGSVKVVPRTKLSEYQKAGLVRADNVGNGK